jgi:hypothetical protein
MRLRRTLILAMLSVGLGWPPGVARASSESPDAVVTQANEQWQASLGVRQVCGSGASIVLEPLPGLRGEYRPAVNQVVIDPGGDIEGMAEIVIHELAHHAFLSCGVFADSGFTQAFYTAQGISTSQDWFDDSLGWSQTPVEQFAEAVAVVIAGRGEGGIEIEPETTDLITRWLAGAPITPSPADSHDPAPYARNDVAVVGGTVSHAGLTQTEPAATPATLPVSQEQPATPSPDSTDRSGQDHPVLGGGRPAHNQCRSATHSIDSGSTKCCPLRLSSPSPLGSGCPR